MPTGRTPAVAPAAFPRVEDGAPALRLSRTLPAIAAVCLLAWFQAGCSSGSDTSPKDAATPGETHDAASSGGHAGGTGGGSTGGTPTGGSSTGGANTGGATGGLATGGTTAATGGATGNAGAPGGRGGEPAGGGHAGGGRQGGAGGASGCDWSSDDGKILLFDGSSLSGWQSVNGGQAPWRLVGDGSMEVVPNSGNIQPKMKFDDLCLHVEYMTPMYAASVTGQQRGNSGIYFRRAYEMQVLDSFGQPPLEDGCGAIYKISPPLVVACHGQLEWNTYEIEFHASQWDASGKKTKNPVFVLATLNGQVVQRDVELKVSMTTSGEADAPGPQPFMLQDHGNTVRYRNIWAKIPR